jgi:hypothetical protein
MVYTPKPPAEAYLDRHIDGGLATISYKNGKMAPKAIFPDVYRE